MFCIWYILLRYILVSRPKPGSVHSSRCLSVAQPMQMPIRGSQHYRARPPLHRLGIFYFQNVMRFLRKMQHSSQSFQICPGHFKQAVRSKSSLSISAPITLSTHASLSKSILSTLGTHASLSRSAPGTPSTHASLGLRMSRSPSRTPSDESYLKVPYVR